MSGFNQCSFIGNLGADPEVRTFQNGGKVCNLRLAVSETWKDKDGQKQERTEWISAAIFNEGLAGVAERYLRKGSKVFIQGKMATRKYQDQAGNDRYSTEIVLRGFGDTLTMLDGAPAGDGRGERKKPADEPAGGGYDDLDDDIPF